MHAAGHLSLFYLRQSRDLKSCKLRCGAVSSQQRAYDNKNHGAIKVQKRLELTNSMYLRAYLLYTLCLSESTISWYLALVCCRSGSERGPRWLHLHVHTTDKSLESALAEGLDGRLRLGRAV